MTEMSAVESAFLDFIRLVVDGDVDGVSRRLTVAAVTNVTRVTLCPRSLQGRDRLALSQNRFGAAMELNQVQPVGP